jgi:cobalt-zinc-cadmium efflux system outer membrane protein
LSQLVVDIVKELAAAGRLRPADTILVRSELDTARALVGQGKVALAVARADLRNQLGYREDSFQLKGELDLPLPTMDYDAYIKAALEMRPDLHARRAAVDEAQARLRLQVADRYGNISFGPSYELDNTQVNYIGFAFFAPIPVLNTHQGEILQSKATVARSMADVRQIEVQSELEVQAALKRFAEARKWADSYANEVLPNLKKSTQDMENLLKNDPGVDVLKVIDVQRNYLRAFDAYLDALLEISQARADLAAAVGDPALALGLYAPQLPAPKLMPAPMQKEQP